MKLYGNLSVCKLNTNTWEAVIIGQQNNKQFLKYSSKIQIQMGRMQITIIMSDYLQRLKKSTRLQFLVLDKRPKQGLERWSITPLSVTQRTDTIKMNV